MWFWKSSAILYFILHDLHLIYMFPCKSQQKAEPFMLMQVNLSAQILLEFGNVMLLIVLKQESDFCISRRRL